MSSSPVVIHGVTFTHTRLVELFKLADAAKPFYEWVEAQCKIIRKNKVGFQDNLMAMTFTEIKELITNCYAQSGTRGVPVLFDGAGKQYVHRKACYYFFSWMLRDAPVQRLQNLVSRAKVNARPLPPTETEAEVLASLFVAYREVIATFDWNSIREVVVDRLFTRDINSAITTAKSSQEGNWVAVFIIAENWSQREQDHVVAIADFAVALKINPGTFETVDEPTQQRLDEFIKGALDGSQTRKTSN